MPNSFLIKLVPKFCLSSKASLCLSLSLTASDSLPLPQCAKARKTSTTSILATKFSLSGNSNAPFRRNAGLQSSDLGLRRRAAVSLCCLLWLAGHLSFSRTGLSAESPSPTRPPPSSRPSQARPALAKRGGRRCRLLSRRHLRSLRRRVILSSGLSLMFLYEAFNMFVLMGLSLIGIYSCVS